MNRIRISRPTQILIAANLVLAITVSAEVLSPAQPATAYAAASSNDPVRLPEFADATLTAPSLSQLVDLLERPLFYPDRRMPEPVVQQAAAPPPMPLRLKLEGVAIAGGSRVAVLRKLSGPGLLQLTEGESHEGWTLDALTSTSARFSHEDGQTAELLLDPGAAH
jgi:hypothetical protein